MSMCNGDECEVWKNKVEEIVFVWFNIRIDETQDI